MKKCMTGIAMIISFCMFSGCGAQPPAADVNDENMTQVSQTEAAADTDNENMAQITQPEAAADTDNETTAQASEPEADMDNGNMTQMPEPETEPDGNLDEVGTLAEEHQEIYGETNPDVLLGMVNISYLVVDSSFAGAEKINTYLYQAEVVDALEYFKDTVMSNEEFIDTESMPYSYDSSVSRIQYFDGKYLSFIQEAYEYLGGAHGLPVWEGYTFDLETGERLLLPDIISNTEEELKDIVTGYFGEMIDKEPDEYWADAKETVHDIITMETTDFALTDDGIRFYMHPYNIAAYSAGFPEVTVPYSEFMMKILE